MPRRSFRRLAPVAAVLALAACAAQQAQPARTAPPGSAEAAAVADGATLVPQERLAILYRGNVVVGETPTGYRYRTYVGPDGGIAANARRGEGRLLVPDDGVACMRFPELWDGEPRCWIHYRVGEGRYRTFHEDGSPAATLTFEAPGPEDR